ncbi:MAG: FliH/SctL family protein [Rhodospirillales bacterium]|jgi:flagellar assembly protein FliH|nr:FliH/SctL family protein [Rhodospirillales bacterium]
MACVEKFTFSRRFPAADELIRRSDEPGPLLIVQRDEEIARIRAEAFAEGRAEGQVEGVAAGRAEAEAEAGAAAERHEAALLDRLCGRLSETMQARDEIAAAAERSALNLAARVLRKALPALHRRLAETETEALLADLSGRMAEPVTLSLRAHPELAAALRARLDAMASRCGVAGRLQVEADASVAQGDCRLAWTGGGAERALAALLARIDEIVSAVAGEEPDAAGAEISGSIEHHG